MVVKRSFVCGLLVVMLAAGTATAQEGRRGGRGPGGPGGPGGFGGGMMMGGGMGLGALLRMEKVHEELELVEDQISDINAAMAELRPAGRGQRGPGGPPDGQRRGGRGEGRGRGDGGGRPDFEAMAAQMREREREVRAKVSEILLPHQMDRLDQLVLQARGIQALSDPEVLAKLNITDEQRATMAGVREELQTTIRERMQEAFQGGRGGGGGQEAFAQMNEMRREMEAKVLAVLTDEQKKTFDEMKGEPFEFPAPQFGPGGRGGRGGRGGEGARGGRRGGN